MAPSTQHQHHMLVAVRALSAQVSNLVERLEHIERHAARRHCFVCEGLLELRDQQERALEANARLVAALHHLADRLAETNRNGTSGSRRPSPRPDPRPDPPRPDPRPDPPWRP